MSRLKSPSLPVDVFGESKILFEVFRACCEAALAMPAGRYPTPPGNHGNHAEAIEVIFDPSVLSYRKLLEFFFRIHDPTTRNRQGNDIGTSYRSAIFYLSEAQKQTAEKTIADMEASKVWPGKVVTEISPAGEFLAAEPEHQDYLQRFPHGYTCHYIRPTRKIAG